MSLKLHFPGIPTAYFTGYARAIVMDKAAAQNYIKHTSFGDPTLDPVMEELSKLHPAELHKFIKAGIDQQQDAFRHAPRILRDFFKDLDTPPWLDFGSFRPGIAAFHVNTNHILVAFLAGALIEGFATLISKSFFITERVIHTDRRLMQNNRQLMEIFLPSGMGRDGDGWKLSARIRFVHARIRLLLKNSPDWDGEAWGIPISAAHLGYAISVFSMRLVHYSKLLGATFSKEEEESISAVWRYTGYVMGIPETILCENMDAAKRIYRIANVCEPAPGKEAVVMANAMIDSAPKLAGITDPKAAQSIIEFAHRISRALLGNKLADQMNFRPSRTAGLLFLYRMEQRYQRLRKQDHKRRLDNFGQLLEISIYDSRGLDYRMPDHVKHVLSNEW